MNRFLTFYIKHFEKWLYNYIIIPIWFFFILYMFFNILTHLPFIKEAVDFWYKFLFPNMSESFFWKPLLTNDHIAILSTFLAAILGIAIPISLSIIANLDNKYSQAGIGKEFINEPLNNAQIYFLITNIFIIISALFFVEFSGWITIFYLIYFFITIISFTAFIALVQKYATDATSIFKNKLEHDVKEYFSKK